jgi:hypothetical protein
MSSGRAERLKAKDRNEQRPPLKTAPCSLAPEVSPALVAPGTVPRGYLFVAGHPLDNTFAARGWTWVSSAKFPWRPSRSPMNNGLDAIFGWTSHASHCTRDSHSLRSARSITCLANTSTRSGPCGVRWTAGCRCWAPGDGPQYPASEGQRSAPEYVSDVHLRHKGPHRRDRRPAQ